MLSNEGHNNTPPSLSAVLLMKDREREREDCRTLLLITVSRPSSGCRQSAGGLSVGQLWGHSCPDH